MYIKTAWHKVGCRRDKQKPNEKMFELYKDLEVFRRKPTKYELVALSLGFFY